MTEGRAPWGTVDVSPASGAMWQRVRLRVYPPGTSRAERRALHFIYSWPISGALASLPVIVVLGDASTPVVALMSVVLLYAGGFLIGARLTHGVRGRIRTIVVATTYVGGEPTVFGNAQLLLAATGRLDELEIRRRAGRIDAVRYEAEWSEIYESLPSRDGARVPND